MQVGVAVTAAFSYGAICMVSSDSNLLELIPEGRLRSLLAKIRERCDASPTLSAIRALSAALLALWAQSVRMKNVSIVDIFWGLSFLVSTVAYTTHQQASRAFHGRKALVLALTSAWASRLSSYLWWRNHMSPHGIGAHGSHEDFRYQNFRRYWDSRGLSYWWFSLLQVFGLQGVLSLIVSAPLKAATTNEQPQHFTSLDLAGFASWVVGYVFEAAGDMELTAFVSDSRNKGKMLQRGLWAYTRHPNYFGNATMWWGIWLISCATKGGWKSFYGPMLMTYLLTDVSGAKLLDKSLRRKTDFASYEKNVPVFVPWGLLGLS